MSNFAVITARGGSKRIPWKNIKNFLGKPIIAYSIEAALKSELFDEVMVSTDSEEIAVVAKKLGAKIPFIRTKKNADDYATTSDVLLEVINKYKKLGKSFDYVCCIYPTAPFISAEKLKDTFTLMIEKKADSVIPVIKYSFPIQRAFKINDTCNLEYIWPDNIHKRSQDLAPSYHDVGQFYWIKTSSLIKNKSLVTNNTIGYELNEFETQDIDTESDWKIAEIKYMQLIKQGSQSEKI